MSEPKTALVTGGAKRIGRAISLRLAEGGYDLLVTYRESAQAARELSEEIRRLGRRCEIVAADLTREDAIDAIVAAWRDAFPRLDLLVNNASVFPEASLENTTRDMIRECLAVHVTAPLLLVQALAEPLREARGSVVNLVDLVEGRGYADYVAYAASKAALLSLTLSLAKSLAPRARANAIAPGAIEWPEHMSDAARRQYLARVPLGRPGTPPDVAEAVWFLAEEAAYVTGTVLRVDGGRWLG